MIVSKTTGRMTQPLIDTAEIKDSLSAMSSEAEKIAQFQGLTGAPEPIARSYLESTHWDLQVHRLNAPRILIHSQQ